MSIHRLLPSSLKENYPLAVMLALSLAYFCCSALCLAFDQRQIMGEYVWVKPCKFGLSIATYAAGLIWLSGYVGSYKALFARYSRWALLGAIIELTALAVQAGYLLTGGHSGGVWHQAVADALAMAIKLGIMPVALLMPVTLFFLIKQKDLPPVLGGALRWAALIATLGMIPGLIMVLPGSHQLVLSHHSAFGHVMSTAGGAHSPISPLLGWSTTGGDLRAAHFFGLHALQVLPLTGLAVMKYLPSWTAKRQAGLITNLGITYTALLILLTFQALLGESFFHPGAETVRLGMAILGLSLAAALAGGHKVRVAAQCPGT
ncbi:MAG: hypothetical protein JST01_16980 [Cyanobacteria bacterium SZAS TMP-1]|nr:hypothetical protein [Cyanobacteria bacterium SZAS TMP-1]